MKLILVIVSKKKGGEKDMQLKQPGPIQYGFEKIGLQRIVGRAETDNIGSWKVLEKCGMTYIGDEEVGGYPVKTYEIWNPSVR